MDSLFDASAFDEVGSDDPDAPVAGAGQLDIFGNVVEEVPVAAPDVDADAPDIQADALPDDGDTDASGSLGVVALVDPDDPDADPGDVLNDPSWEPPIEVPDEVSLVAVTAEPTPPVEVAAAPEVVAGVPVAAAVAVTAVPVVPDEPVERRPSVDALWRAVVGQPTAVAQLRAAAQQPVHAYLLVGPPGSGTRDAATAFGAALLCPRGGCADCNVCRAAAAGEHPDLVVVERVGASISVDQAREIIRVAMRAPSHGERKVLVLVDFHLVTAAGPTLLKVIEEPPPSTVFVILADQVTADLVTIASRCVQIPFRSLGREAVVDALVADGVEPARAEEVARVAGGRLDRARLLAADAALAQRVELWRGIPRRLDDTGATVSVITAEVLALLDQAAVGPLQEVQAAELAAFDERDAAVGGRGSAGARTELLERHKRELKRLRDDELRLGLTVLQQAYRDAAVDAVTTGADVLARRATAAVGAIDDLVRELARNPNLTVALWGLLAGLVPLR